jgi:hypothetical protein|tara:strand:+ start:141 stop:800 length:660 start_codon:yes stop_codon:yes gene_type:complete
MYYTQLPNFETEVLKIIGIYSENEFILKKNNEILNIKYLCYHCKTYQIQENYQKFIPTSYKDFNKLMENVYSHELEYEINDVRILNPGYILCIKCFITLIHKPILGISSLPLIVDELDRMRTFSDNEIVSHEYLKQNLKDNDIKKINNLFFEEKYENDMKKLIKKHDYKIYDLNILKKYYRHFNFKRKKHLKDSRIQQIYLQNKRIQHKKRKWNFLPKC